MGGRGTARAGLIFRHAGDRRPGRHPVRPRRERGGRIADKRWCDLDRTGGRWSSPRRGGETRGPAARREDASEHFTQALAILGRRLLAAAQVYGSQLDADHVAGGRRADGRNGPSTDANRGGDARLSPGARAGDLVDLLAKAMQDQGEVRALYASLDDVSQKAVQEATHDPEGVLHSQRFWAKYSSSPNFGGSGRRYDNGSKPAANGTGRTCRPADFVGDALGSSGVSGTEMGRFGAGGRLDLSNSWNCQGGFELFKDPRSPGATGGHFYLRPIALE
jgi:hypothetical protein